MRKTDASEHAALQEEFLQWLSKNAIEYRWWFPFKRVLSGLDAQEIAAMIRHEYSIPLGDFNYDPQVFQFIYEYSKRRYEEHQEEMRSKEL